MGTFQSYKGAAASWDTWLSLVHTGGKGRDAESPLTLAAEGNGGLPGWMRMAVPAGSQGLGGCRCIQTCLFPPFSGFASDGWS